MAIWLVSYKFTNNSLARLAEKCSMVRFNLRRPAHWEWRRWAQRYEWISPSAVADWQEKMQLGSNQRMLERAIPWASFPYAGFNGNVVACLRDSPVVH